MTYFQQGEIITKVDYLYLDANGLLHEAAQQVENYGQRKRALDPYQNFSSEAKRQKIYSLFFDKIRDVARMVKPAKVLYIAIDGPAPFAKAVQQRERRFIAAANRTGFDSNAITPGTTFMNELALFLDTEIRRARLGEMEIIFSPPSVPGEGEHKIMDYLRALPEEEKRLSHCLYGPDGDLIMLTLASHINNMFLFREDQFSVGHYHLLDMGMIRKELPEFIHGRSESEAVNDFVVEGFFVGNDFLPKIQMFHLLDEGLNFMIANSVPTTTSGQFDLPGFKSFVRRISKYEQDFLIEQVTTKERRKQPPEPKFRNETLLECISFRGGKHVLDFPRYRKLYYAKAGIAEEKGIQGMCRDYLRGFVWVFDYYVNGLPSWQWAYKHHYAPLMSDFKKYVDSLDDETVIEFEMLSPMLPFEQLLSVLPASSSSLLPPPFAALMLNDNSPLVRSGYYPETFQIDFEGKLKEYQGVALIPFVSYEKVHRVYRKMASKTRRYARNRVGEVRVY